MLDVAPTELLLVAVVAVIVIGPKDLPRAMRMFLEFAGNATTGDWLEAHADIVRAGRRVVFVNCFVYHGSERIARGSGTFIVVGASDDGPRVTTSDSVAARDPAATG